MTAYIGPDMTEAELTSNVGRTFQPGNRVTSKYGTDHRVGTVHGNRYFGAGIYGVLVLLDGESSARYIDAIHLRAVYDRAVCEHCKTEMDADELTPDHNSDPTCSDCLSTFADQDDATEYRAYAYR